MKLFGKRGRHDGSDDAWTLAQGVVDGHPTFIRSKHTKRDRSRPVKVTVRIGLTEPDPHGLPGSEEMDFLADVEDILVEELDQHGAELVLVVTANYAREFIAYGASHGWLEAWGPSVLSRWGPGRPGTGVDAVAEPDWATYRALAIR